MPDTHCLGSSYVKKHALIDAWILMIVASRPWFKIMLSHKRTPYNRSHVYTTKDMQVILRVVRCSGRRLLHSSLRASHRRQRPSSPRSTYQKKPAFPPCHSTGTLNKPCTNPAVVPHSARLGCTPARSSCNTCRCHTAAAHLGRAAAECTATQALKQLAP